MFGCFHNREIPESRVPDGGYEYGYLIPRTRFRTIMASANFKYTHPRAI